MANHIPMTSQAAKPTVGTSANSGCLIELFYSATPLPCLFTRGGYKTAYFKEPVRCQRTRDNYSSHQSFTSRLPWDWTRKPRPPASGGINTGVWSAQCFPLFVSIMDATGRNTESSNPIIASFFITLVIYLFVIRGISIAKCSTVINENLWQAETLAWFASLADGLDQFAGQSSTSGRVSPADTPAWRRNLTHQTHKASSYGICHIYSLQFVRNLLYTSPIEYRNIQLNLLLRPPEK